jgi:hypothetical protein
MNPLLLVALQDDAQFDPGKEAAAAVEVGQQPGPITACTLRVILAVACPAARGSLFSAAADPCSTMHIDIFGTVSAKLLLPI